MQDFRNFDYTVTPQTLKDMLESGYQGNITVIINGEYYDLKDDFTKNQEGPKS